MNPERVEDSPTNGEADGAPAAATAADDAAATPTNPSADVALDDPLAALTAERDAALEQVKEYLALAQRAQADFQNYRRRAEQERTEAYERGRAEILLQVLPVLDDFERALAALPEERLDEDWLQGLLLIERKLRGTLESLGVERIAAEGSAFDPWEHEAVLHEVRDDSISIVADVPRRLLSRLQPASA